MNICILDDHLLFAQSLKLLLNKVPGAQVSVYTTPTDFLSQDFTGWQPDLVITDVMMPAMTGVELMEKAKSLLGEQTQFLLLTALHDIPTLKNAIRRGASGYVTKDISEEELLEAIRSIQAKQVPYIQKSMKDKLIVHMFSNEEEVVTHLSKKEKQVLNSICDGRIPKEIAAEMQLSINTINQYIKSLKRKFKVNRTTDIALFAVKNGLYEKSH